MALFMKENFGKELNMAMVSINGQIALFTRVSGRIMNSMVGVITFGVITGVILENGNRI